jgi:SET domain-containing protein
VHLLLSDARDAMQGNAAHYINHSCDPNCVAVQCPVENEVCTTLMRTLR